MITREQVLLSIKRHRRKPETAFFTIGKMGFSHDAVRKICSRYMEDDSTDTMSGDSNATLAEIQEVLDTHLAMYLEELEAIEDSQTNSMSSGDWALLGGDILHELGRLPDGTFDGCFTDPPYGLSFMGQKWDHGVPGVKVWSEVLRVLKPGAMMLAFGGTRTHHRLWCAIEDAGFEVRDCLMWVYGSGFPKSLNISKAIDKAAGAERGVVGVAVYGDGHTQHSSASIGFGGCDPGVDTRVITAPATEAAKHWNGYGTALKPAYEPILLAMKPIDGTFVSNALKHGVAGLNVDGCRVAYEDTQNPATNPLYRIQNDYRVKVGNDKGGSSFSIKPDGGEVTANVKGRWPTNLIHDGSDEVVRGFPETGISSGGGRSVGGLKNTHSTRAARDQGQTIGYGDSGSAARFFYVPKANSAERNVGGVKNTHPTVKPLKLCEYLARLILPPGRDSSPRRVLIPFSGSGSEMVGALNAGWDHVTGIENNPQWSPVVKARIEHRREQA